MTAPALRKQTMPRRIEAAADLRPAERVAVVLSLLAPDSARAVAADWAPGSVDAVVAAYEGLGTLPRTVVLEVVAGFVAALSGPGPSVRGGLGAASELAAAILPTAVEAKASTDEALAADAPPERVWAHAASLPTATLATLLSDERPAVIGAVLSRLGDTKGGALLAALGEEAAVAAAAHLAGGRPPAPRTVDAVATQLRDKAAKPEPAKRADTDPATPLIALLNRCPLSRQAAVLAVIEADQADLASRVEAGLLRFATLSARLPRTIAPVLFREADQATLDTALRYAADTAPETADYLYSSISQRLAEQIRERVAALAAPSPDDGEAAQAEIIATLMAWAAEGRFELAAPGAVEEE